VTNPDSLQSVIRATIDKFAWLDVLHNFAWLDVLHNNAGSSTAQDDTLNPHPAATSEIAENIDSASAPEAAAGLAAPTRRRYTASRPAASTSSRHRRRRPRVTREWDASAAGRF